MHLYGALCGRMSLVTPASHLDPVDESEASCDELHQHDDNDERRVLRGNGRHGNTVDRQHG